MEKEKIETTKVEVDVEEVKEEVQKEKVKTKTSKVDAIPAFRSPFQMAFTMLKTNSSGLLFSILGLLLSVFVLTFAFSIKAQTGVTLIATIILAVYVIFVGIASLLIGLFSVYVTKDKLNEPRSLVGFILSLLTIGSLIGSVLVIYLT